MALIGRFPNARQVALAAAASFALIVPPARGAEPSGELAGVVVDLNNHPVPNAQVSLIVRPDQKVASAETNAEGRFRIGPMAPLCRAWLLVDASGFGREHRENVSIFPGAVDEIRIVVAPGRTVRGRILDIDGQPASHVGVTYHIYRIVMGRYLVESIGTPGQVTTDARGEFRVDNVPPCRFYIDVRAPGAATGALREDIQPGSGAHTLKPLWLTRDVPIEGVVHDPQGEPLPGIPVTTNWVDSRTAVTDAAGRFELRGFAAAHIPRVKVRIAAPGFASTEVDVGDHPSAVEILLKPQRWISGRVVDAETGAPVAIKTVIRCWFTRLATGGIDRGNCRPVPFEQPQPGHFRVAYDVPYNIHITVRCPGYDDAEVNLDKRPAYADINGIVIKVRRNGSRSPADTIPVAKITGRLTRDGQPVTSAWVSLVRRPVERKMPYVTIARGRMVRREQVPSQSVLTTSGGRYLLEARNVGNWYVVIEQPNHAPTIRGPLELNLNQTVNLDLQLDDGGAIVGRVADIPADAAGQWWVVAFDRTVWIAETRVAKDGAFRLDRLPPGEFGLKVGHDAYHEAGNPDHPTVEDEKLQVNAWPGTTLVKVEPGQSVAGVRLSASPIAPVGLPAPLSTARSRP